MTHVIETINLSKKFKKSFGVKELNFKLNQGEICALIGRNGAGKSTLFKLLSNQIKPTNGEIKLFNKSPIIKKNLRKRIGFMIENPEFISHFSAFKNLKYFSIQRGISDEKLIHRVLNYVDLNGVDKQVKEYSLGMKQRLGIALALLCGPDILVLDEPINGLDAQGIKDFRNLIFKLNQEQNITILLSSHILSELQQLASRFVFIDNGTITEDLTKEELQAKSKKFLLIEVDNRAKATQVLESSIKDINYRAVSYTHLTLPTNREV